MQIKSNNKYRDTPYFSNKYYAIYHTKIIVLIILYFYECRRYYIYVLYDDPHIINRSHCVWSLLTNLQCFRLTIKQTVYCAYSSSICDMKKSH